MGLISPEIHFNSMLLVREMERRNITVTHVKGTKKLVATYSGHEEIVDDTDLSVMPPALRQLLDNKKDTKALLKKLRIPTPEGKAFRWKDIEKAKKYAQKIFPIVLKPIHGSQGLGVRINIDTPEELEFEFYKLVETFGEETEFLIEEQIFGAEFRLTVTRNGFMAAAHRACPKVRGDGNSSIIELIDIENKRRMNPRSNCLCEIWMEDKEVERYLAKKGLTVEYIPKKDEVVYVRGNSNVSTGAECIDVTDMVHPYYHLQALQILQKIPGLPYCGIDLITDDISAYSRESKYVICEVNPAPGLSLHTHPSSGKPRDLPKALIDLIFPECV